MIDIESDIFGEVASAVLKAFPGAFVTDEYLPVPPAFPCVMVIEMSNTTHEGTTSSAGIENHAVVMYEVNVYSNSISSKKQECKAIAGLVSDVFTRMGFARTMHNPLPNMADATIYRITSRYTGLVSQRHVIYRR